jgi:NAD(P)-dependent dehydrogenase (short-subunit alcohol dehydrogenase family)
MKRVVIITGVSGGIGSATAEVFSEAGWHVVGVDKRKNSERTGISRFIDGDISQPDIPGKILLEVSSNEGRIDALVNNAAVQICRPLLETSQVEWDSTMATNIRSAYLFTKAAYPLLKESTGAIVNVCSVHASANSQGLAAYAVSKGALLALSRVSAVELAADGIRVNAVLPGAVDTKMLRAGLERIQVETKNAEKLLQGLGSRHPLGRVGEPEEVGRAILFLADNQQSSFITGQTLVVDGGALAKLSTE